MTDSNSDAWLDDSTSGPEVVSGGASAAAPSSIKRLKVGKGGGDGGARLKQLLINIGVVFGFISLVSAGVYGYKAMTRPSRVVVAVNPDVPLLAADETPAKVRPDEPGGMEIPDQDKMVYEVIDEEQGEEEVERLLPPPEEPTVTETEVAEAEPEPVVPPAPDPPAPEVTVTEQPAAPEPQETQTAAVEPVPAPEPAPAPAVTLTPDERWLVQIASFRSSANADAGWLKLFGQYEDILGEFEPDIARVDLGADKGIYYRLRAGPLSSKASARELCGKLKERGLSCLVVGS